MAGGNAIRKDAGKVGYSGARGMPTEKDSTQLKAAEELSISWRYPP
jgi:hypothetical protein